MMDNRILNIHYLAVMFTGLAMFCSFIIMIHAVHNLKLRSFNTWQFPMLLALFFDGAVSIYY